MGLLRKEIVAGRTIDERLDRRGEEAVLPEEGGEGERAKAEAAVAQELSAGMRGRGDHST